MFTFQIYRLTNHPARRAPTGHIAQSRLQTGAYHSHIQVIPRDEDDYSGEDNCKDSVPTFRSPSLQFPSDSSRVPRIPITATDETGKKTFAEMARRFNRNNAVNSEDRPAAGPVSLARLIKVHPNHRKASNKTYRPMRLSDFGEDENDNDAEESDSEHVTSFPSHVDEQLRVGHHPASTNRLRPSPFDLPRLDTNTRFSSTQTIENGRLNPSSQVAVPLTPVRARSEDISPLDTRYVVVDDFTRLFGKNLPDPIELSVKVGEFDGQIMFIGHPNRDISAHQWDMTAYQWVNIGLYSNTRHRIEGSLASDRLRAPSISHNSMEYFKAVADQREAIAQAGPSACEAKSAEQSTVLGLGSPNHANQDDADHFASLSGESRSSREQLPGIDDANKASKAKFTPRTSKAAAPVPESVTQKFMDDPFVTPADVSNSVIPSASFAGTRTGHPGLMDFGYVFPGRNITSAANKTNTMPASNTDSQKQLFKNWEHERLETIRREANVTEKPLAEVGFGEEALSAYDGHRVTRQPIAVVPDDSMNRQKLKTQLSELADQIRRPVTLMNQTSVAVPIVTRPPSGLTVANPHRIVSTLNATATPYIAPANNQAQRDQKDSESEGTAANGQIMASLKFSDPDGNRQVQAHEIANGLRNEVPTKQNLRGPFFTHHMPTTQHPTTSLSIEMGWEEKLKTWFHDGQRPARQQEFSHTIIAGANTEARTRRMVTFGAIGQLSSHKKSRFETNRYENTSAFVRLYENISVYSEEIRAGKNRDYFTKAWKPAKLEEIGSRMNVNNSFFGGAQKASSQIILPPFSGQDCRGLNNMSPWTFSQGYIKNGGFGGPV